MNEILDDFETRPKKAKFSLAALICGVATLFFFATMANLFSGTITASEGIPKPSILQIRGTQFFAILGILFTILSIFKNEPWDWKKWISVLLNSLLFIIIFGSICFYYYVEFTKSN